MEQKHTPGPITFESLQEVFLKHNPDFRFHRGSHAWLIKAINDVVVEQVSALTKELEVLKQQHDFNCEYKTLEIVRLTEQTEKLKAENETFTEMNTRKAKELKRFRLDNERLREERKELMEMLKAVFRIVSIEKAFKRQIKR